MHFHSGHAGGLRMERIKIGQTWNERFGKYFWPILTLAVGTVIGWLGQGV